ncbi:MAG: hypothetical protein NVSMB24_38960 [Mucilaginibacter sp.]
MIKQVNAALMALGLEANEHTMIAYWDNDLICRFANGAHVDWFGKIPADIVDKIKLPDLLGDLYIYNIKYINGVLAGKVQVFENDIVVPKGMTLNSIVTYLPDNHDGKVKGFYSHISDVTFLKHQNSIEWPTKEHAKYVLISQEEIIEAIERYLRSTILIGFPGISALAKRFFISESKLKRDFKFKYRSTLFSFFRNLQMSFADTYIREKIFSKKQMAALLHLENPSNFLTCYKKYLANCSQKNNVEVVQRNAMAHAAETDKLLSDLVVMTCKVGHKYDPCHG